MERPIGKHARRIFGFLKNPTFLFLTFFGNFILLFAVVAVYLLEKNVNPLMSRFMDALWWGVTTITTVGYGDVVPVTTSARLIGLALMYTGTVLFIAFTSLLATYWVRTEVEQEITPLEKDIKREVRETRDIELALKDIQERLERIERQATHAKK